MKKSFKRSQIGFNSFLFLILLLVSISSCNLRKIQKDQQIGTLKRHGFKKYIYKNGNTEMQAYAKLTNKPILVLVHGFSADGVLQWHNTANLLSKDYDIILPDLIYHGESKSTTNEYSLEFQAQQLYGLLHSINQTKDLTLVGSSYGGAVSLMYSQLYPNTVSKLVLNDAVTPYFSSEMANQTAKSIGMKDIVEMMSPSTPEKSKAKLSIVYHKPPKLPRFIHKQISKATQLNKENRKKILETLIANEEKYSHYDYTIKCPIYFIWGEKDALIPLNTARKMMEVWGIPVGNLVVIPETAHVPNIESPKAFHKALEGILMK